MVFCTNTLSLLNSTCCFKSFVRVNHPRGLFIFSVSLGPHLWMPSLFMMACPQLRGLRHAAEQVVPVFFFFFSVLLLSNSCHLPVKTFLPGILPMLFLYVHTCFAGPSLGSISGQGSVDLSSAIWTLHQALCSIIHKLASTSRICRLQAWSMASSSVTSIFFSYSHHLCTRILPTTLPYCMCVCCLPQI